MSIQTLSNQQVFDRVATHLLTQKAKATDVGGNCFYRSPNGLKCAVGCLVSDETYVPVCEGVGMQGLIDLVLGEWKGTNFNAAAQKIAATALHKSLGESGISSESYPLLLALQALHDTFHAGGWAKQLRSVAAAFNLSAEAVPCAPK